MVEQKRCVHCQLQSGPLCLQEALLSDGGSVEDMQATFARVVSLSGSLGEEQICNIQKKVK